MSAPLQPTARQQATAALIGLLAMAMVVGPLAYCTRSPAFIKWVDALTELSDRQTGAVVYHSGWFTTPEEIWMYKHDVPPDYARGGVFFFGPSALDFGLRFWTLPEEQQKLIHNYALPASNPLSDKWELEYLIRSRGALTPPHEKNLVIFGLSYPATSYNATKLPEPTADNWSRQGLFTADTTNGIKDVQMNPVARFLSFEELFQTRCLITLEKLGRSAWHRWRNHGVEPRRVLSRENFKELRHWSLGPDWKIGMRDNLAQLGRNIDWLKSMHVQVKVVLLPEETWESEVPYSAEFHRQLSALCQQKEVEMVDWSKLLPDEDFADSTHTDIEGAEIETQAALKIALPFLRSTGALPPDAAK